MPIIRPRSATLGHAYPSEETLIARSSGEVRPLAFSKDKGKLSHLIYLLINVSFILGNVFLYIFIDPFVSQPRNQTLGMPLSLANLNAKGMFSLQKFPR